jgi:hypothetical protein
VTGADEGADEVATEVDEGFGGCADDKDTCQNENSLRIKLMLITAH